MLREVTWAPQSPDLNRVELVWDEMHLRANQTGHQVLSISGNVVKTGAKPVQVNPLMPRGCKAVKKAKGVLSNILSCITLCNSLMPSV